MVSVIMSVRAGRRGMEEPSATRLGRAGERRVAASLRDAGRCASRSDAPTRPGPSPCRRGENGDGEQVTDSHFPQTTRKMVSVT